MRRLLLLSILLTLMLVAWPVSSDLQAQSTPFLHGTSTGYGWTISVVGSRGTFKADGVGWQIEYIYQNEGISGFKHALWFLGRKPDNLMLLHIYADDSGTSFIGIYYDYKERTQRAERFVGSYNLSGLTANPSLLEGYVPRGRVPAYIGQDFRLSSPYAHIAPAGGTVSYQELQLRVYAVFNAIATPIWSEIWAIGIDPNNRHTYFLHLYTISSSAWIIDLWSGRVTSAPLGQVIVTGGQVTVEHNVEL